MKKPKRGWALTNKNLFKKPNEKTQSAIKSDRDLMHHKLNSAGHCSHAIKKEIIYSNYRFGSTPTFYI